MAVFIVVTLIVGSTIFGGIVAAALFLVRFCRMYIISRALPGPSGIPIMGNALQFSGSREDMMDRMSSLFDTYSPICRLWLGPHLVIGLDDPELIKIMMVKNKLIERAFLRDFLGPWLGDGLITVPHDKWHTRRRRIGSVMNTTTLRSYAVIFAAQSEVMAKNLKIYEDGPHFDVVHYISLCLIDIICETTMGSKVGAQAENNCEYVSALHQLSENVAHRFVTAWLHPRIIFNLTRYGATNRSSIKIVRRFAESIIEKKIKEQYNESRKDEDNNGRTNEFQSLVDLLMKNVDKESRLSIREMVDEVNTTLGAGVDTSTSTITFTWMMLAVHPDVQEKAFQELCDIFGNDERPITYNDALRMEYLERVIKETLRLFPSVSTLPRVVFEDLELGGYTIPRGAKLVAVVTRLHRNEQFWPDPLKFDPDRFLPEEIAKRHPYAYLPFGCGPRICFGYKYAMLSMKMICATILRRYIVKTDKITSISDVKIIPRLTNFPGNASPIRIERRSKKSGEIKE